LPVLHAASSRSSVRLTLAMCPPRAPFAATPDARPL